MDEHTLDRVVRRHREVPGAPRRHPRLLPAPLPADGCREERSPPEPRRRTRRPGLRRAPGGRRRDRVDARPVPGDGAPPDPAAGRARRGIRRPRPRRVGDRAAPRRRPRDHHHGRLRDRRHRARRPPAAHRRRVRDGLRVPSRHGRAERARRGAARQPAGDQLVLRVRPGRRRPHHRSTRRLRRVAARAARLLGCADDLAHGTRPPHARDLDAHLHAQPRRRRPGGRPARRCGRPGALDVPAHRGAPQLPPGHVPERRRARELADDRLHRRPDRRRARDGARGARGIRPAAVAVDALLAADRGPARRRRHRVPRPPAALRPHRTGPTGSRWRRTSASRVASSPRPR